MAMHNLNLLSDNDVAKDGKEGKHSGESSLSVDDKEGDMVDLEAVGEVADTGAPFVSMGDDDDFMAAVDQFCRELVDVAFHPARLGEEEVADHGDVERHCGGAVETGRMGNASSRFGERISIILVKKVSFPNHWLLIELETFNLCCLVKP